LLPELLVLESDLSREKYRLPAEIQANRKLNIWFLTWGVQV